jgi:hypothetical protein
MSIDLTEEPELVTQLTTHTVSFGIPAYNEGKGIVPTLNSLWAGMRELGILDAPIIVSDSANTAPLAAAPHVTAWAAQVGGHVIVDHSDRRRSQKEALNNIFEIADSDLLIQVNADVLVPTSSLAALFRHLLAEPRPFIAIGGILPDPAFNGLERRAGAWQMRSVWRAAYRMPRDAVRSEGAFWGAWRKFYANFHYRVGGGSLADDVELAAAIHRDGIPVHNAADAFVYKVAPGSLQDFCSGLVRWSGASPQYRRGRSEYSAALIEAVRDPAGAALYSLGLIWCLANRRRFRTEAVSEMWTPLQSTKRARD